jgi:hypothetical protein
MLRRKRVNQAWDTKLALRNESVEVLTYLKRSVLRLRELAAASHSELAAQMLLIADEIANDAARLETELVAGGYLPEPPSEGAT